MQHYFSDEGITKLNLSEVLNEKKPQKTPNQQTLKF